MTSSYVNDQLPILYSFRRCPYAMRARMALAISGAACRLREVVLRDKPQEMLDISPKATVPVLQIEEDKVLEESLEIMLWALSQNDPEDWLGDSQQQKHMLDLIQQTQDKFKVHLDRYKYPNRYKDIDPIFHREEALKFLKELKQKICTQHFLYGSQPSLADIAIFPFVRQFANTNRIWFDSVAEIDAVQQWLDRCLSLKIFEAIMEKYPQWTGSENEIIFSPLP